MSSSLIKAFEIVDYIKEHPKKAKLTEISNGTGLNKTTVFRYLESLSSLKLLERRGDCYALGLGFLFYSGGVDTYAIIKKCVHVLLEELAREVNETVNIAVLYNKKALYLDKAEGSRSLRMKSSVGDALPLHCTAIGKAILASSADDVIEMCLEEGMTGYTDRTITEKEEILTQLKTIKQEGISIEDEEYEEGLACMAAPLVVENISFVGAISISGPSSRFPKEKRDDLKDILRTYRDRMKMNIIQGGKHD